MDQKIEKQGRAVTQVHERYDIEFGKLVALKQERKKLQQELSSLDANSTGLLVLPQADTVADEQVKAELNALLTQEQALPTARKQMALGFAANPTLVRQRCVERNPTTGDVIPTRRLWTMRTTWTSQTSRQTIRSSR